MRFHFLGFHGRVPWPPPIALTAAVLLIGAALLFAAIVIRRKFGAAIGTVALLLAALWNAGIVFVFMSPHNRHVFHLATHRESVIVNAAIGVVWLLLCVVAVAKWFRGERTS